MARWKLLNAHYLLVAGNTWEYKEVDRTTGRNKRVEFEVPQHLNPFDPTDWNYRDGKDDGWIIVSDGHNPEPKDIIFSGNPTPDMEPVDDEARRITAEWAPRWKHPIDSLSPNFSQSLIDGFHKDMEALQAKQAEAGPSSDMKELTATVSEMAKSMTEFVKASRRA